MVQWYNSTVLQCYSSTVVQQYRFLLPEWDVEMENVTMFHLATEGSTEKSLLIVFVFVDSFTNT